MPWTEQNQRDAEQEANEFFGETITKWEAWVDAVKAGAPTAASSQAAVEDAVRRWQQSLSQLQAQSDSIASNDSVMDELNQLAQEVAQEKTTLRKLRSEAGTRADQADSVNPKVRPSPYTNILGLNRVFRDSTNFNIMIASIAFGVLALGSLGYLVYSVTSTGNLVPTQYIQGGTGRTKTGAKE
jgi:hypothetical protein